MEIGKREEERGREMGEMEVAEGKRAAAADVSDSMNFGAADGFPVSGTRIYARESSSHQENCPCPVYNF